jgi:hypothetical protein
VNKRPRKNAVFLALAIAAMIASMYFWNAAANHRQKFESWQNARPVDAIIDLTKPGEYTLPFEQTCSIHHGEGVYVVRPEHVDQEIEGPKLLAGLLGTITIADADGSEVAQADIVDERAGFFYDNGDIRLTGLHGFPIGTYSANIRIDSGANDQSLSQVRLYAIYELCGLELLPAQLSGFAAVGTGAIALIAVAYLAWAGFKRKMNSVAETPS